MTVVRRAVIYISAVAGSSTLAAFAYAVQLGVVTKTDEIFGASSAGVWPFTALVGFVLALPAFAIGTAAVGIFVWLILGRVEKISKQSAALFGALLATLGGGLLFAVTLGFAGLLLALPLPLSGAVGGIALRNVMRAGFRQFTPPPAPPA